MKKPWDIAVLGGGPGGYVAAIRAAQLNKKVVLIEKERVGGTCMNWGCIPTKFLLHQTGRFKDLLDNRYLDGPLKNIKVNWKNVQKGKNQVVNKLVQGLEYLLKKIGTEVIKGEARLIDERKVAVIEGNGEKVYEANKIILATGARPAELPGLRPNGKEIITSRQALDLDDVPKKMVVIGAGAIGLEIGVIFQRLGTEVIVLEIMPTILPGSDREMMLRMERVLKRQGMNIYTHMKIEESFISDEGVCIKGTSVKNNAPFEFVTDVVLLAVGRIPNVEYFEEKMTDKSLDRGRFLKVNSHLETEIPGVYGIGDLVGGKLLAHKASHEGLVAVENIAGIKKTMDYDAVPMAIYTDPEYSCVGITEQEALERGLKIQVGRFSLQANGRAVTMEDVDGMVKLIADKQDKLIGAHILAPHASEIISEMTLALKKGMKVQDVASSIHIHPTLSEAVMEAAMKVKNQALHILNL